MTHHAAEKHSQISLYTPLMLAHTVLGQWALRLIPLLTGKALEAFSRLSEEDSVEYEKVKTTILVRYELTSEAINATAHLDMFPRTLKGFS
jgi:hypothetical protein